MEDVVETGITLRLWKSVLNSATPVADTGFHEGGFHSNNARGARAKSLRPRPQGG